jgi:chromosome segregation ATPase
MNNKHAIIVGSLIALAICLWFLLQPDKQHDAHTSDHAEVIADKAALDSQGVVYRHIIDSLSIDNYRLDSANKSLKKGQAATETKLNAKSAEVRTLVAQIREINTDTGYFGHLLNSLQQQVESLNFLIVQYEQYADSINNVNDSLKIGYEAMIKEKDKRIAELQATYDELLIKYNRLFETKEGLQSDLKRQNLKTKVAAVLGGALAVLALLK